jgi:hypothetical protein
MKNCGSHRDHRGHRFLLACCPLWPYGPYALWRPQGRHRARRGSKQLLHARRAPRQWFDKLQLRRRVPVHLAQAPDNGFCESVLFWHVQHGRYGDMNLDDLSFVRVGRWEGDLWAGRAKGTAGIYIDERADERQAEILPRIFGGQVGGFPALVAGLVTEGRLVRAPLRTPA